MFVDKRKSCALFAILLLLTLLPLQAYAAASITVNGLSSGASVQAGIPITVAAAGGAGNAADWIAICNTATPGSSANCQHAWVYLQNCGSALPGSGVTANTCTIISPPVTGTWFADFLTNGGLTAMASASFTVTTNTVHPEIVQAPVTSFTSTSPCVWTLPQLITPGDTVVGFVHTSNSTDTTPEYPSSVTDNASNTYTLSSGVQWLPYPEDIGIFYLSGVTGGPTQLNVNFTDGISNSCNVGFVEYRGKFVVSPISGPTDDASGPTPSMTISPTVSWIWALGAINTNYGSSLLTPNYADALDASGDGIAVWTSNLLLSGSQTLTWSNPYYNATVCLDGTHGTECSALMILAAIKDP